MKHAILCLDDESDIVDALERLFRKKYSVLKATSGDEGLALLRKHPEVAVIISDQRMPGMTGVEFLKTSQKSHPETVRILLTGYTDVESVISAINDGHIYRYVTKPWDPVDLSNAVDKGVERYLMGLELREKNKALEKAYAELKTLDEAKNHFMILINHELKTPLTTILSYLELLRESKLSAEQTKCVSRIQQGADRLKSLIADALELVSAETGVLKISPKKLVPHKVGEELKSEFQELADTKKHRLNWRMGSEAFKADPKIVRSVLSRLIDNAIKFSPEGSEIEISTQVADNDQLEFRVENPGKALTSKMIDKILRPFSLDEDIMHHTQGAGLGLSVSQALLKTHSSKLDLASGKGQITVSFLLPLA